MADNVTTNPGSGGATFATDDVSGVHYPISKIAFGPLDSATLVTPSTPFPVTLGAQALAAIGDAATTFTSVVVGSIPLMWDGTNYIRTRGTAANGLLVNTELPAAAALGDALTTITTPIVGGINYVWDGTNYVRATGNVANGLDVDVTRQPARAATTDSISVKLATDKLMDNLTTLTPKFATIDLSATGALVTAVTGKKIRVLSYTLVCDAALTVQFQSATTPVSGAMSIAENGGVVTSFSPIGILQTATGEALNLAITGTGNVAGHLTYVEV